MLVHRRVTPGIKFAGSHLHTWVERGTVHESKVQKVCCLRTQRKITGQAGSNLDRLIRRHASHIHLSCTLPYFQAWEKESSQAKSFTFHTYIWNLSMEMAWSWDGILREQKPGTQHNAIVDSLSTQVACRNRMKSIKSKLLAWGYHFLFFR